MLICLILGSRYLVSTLWFYPPTWYETTSKTTVSSEGSGTTSMEKKFKYPQTLTMKYHLEFEVFSQGVFSCQPKALPLSWIYSPLKRHLWGAGAGHQSSLLCPWVTEQSPWVCWLPEGHHRYLLLPPIYLGEICLTGISWLRYGMVSLAPH